MDSSSLRLRERPFPAAPTTAAYFPADSLEQARRQLERCIERAEGVGLVIGAAGMGKSLLAALLSEQFRGRFHVANLAGTAVGSRRALLQSILFELGLPYRGLEEGELRLSLMDYLHPSRECPHGMLLLVDEAHTLPLRLLEEIRLLTNLVREGTPRVRLVLAGSAVLDERLANPKLDSFNQRIAARLYLQSFSSGETAEYVRRELTRCGGDPAAIVRDDALRTIHLATCGIPRLVNQLCDHALVLAKTLPLTGAAIQEAWSDLQRLPGPWNDPPPAPSAAIEFGSLDHDSEESTTYAFTDSHLVLGFCPQSAISDQQSEIPEPLVPPAAELFGEGYDEEIVLDRYSALDISALGELPQVNTVEGAAFLCEVATASELAPVRPALKIAELDESATVSLPGPLAAQVAQARSKAEKASADLVASFDPVYPEEEPVVEPSEMRIALIDAAESGVPAPHSQSLAGSSRFRNLFASLRGKK